MRVAAPFVVSFVGSFFVAALVGAQSPAAPPGLQAAVQKLFADSWEKSAEGLAAADRNHSSAKQVAPADPRVDYALALVQFRYLRYDDAERTLNRLSQSSPNYLPGLQAQIYLSVLMKKHGAALTQLEDLHRRIIALPDDGSRADERRESLEFLGRVLGYYGGPAQRAASQPTVAELRRKVLETVTTQERDAFSAAFGSVVDRFTQLDDDKRRSQEETKAAEIRQKELDIQRLQAEKQGVAAEKDSLARQAADAQARAQGEVDQLDRQIAPLDAEYARINAQGLVIRNTIAQLDLSISSLLSQADEEDDPGVRAALLNRADFLTVQARRAEIDYQALDAQAAQVLARRNVLQQQRAGVVAQYEATARQLGVQAAKLTRNESRITVEQKKALKPSTGFSPQVQDKTTAVASITTYVEFPLEREKARLLRSLE